MTKYLIITIAILFGFCVLFFNLWDNTKEELNNVIAERELLKTEIERRNENEKNLSKRLQDLEKIYSANRSWADGIIPADIITSLQNNCKACQ